MSNKSKYSKPKDSAPAPSGREDDPPEPVSSAPKQKQRQGLAKSRPRQVKADAFKPKKLSTEHTAFKNDPHSKESIVVDGYSGLVKSAPLHFSNDFSQYITIVRSLYAQIAKGSKPFKLNVSLAMFEYYATVILWQRLFTVLSERDLDSNISEDFTKKLGTLLIPIELVRYLEGIGNIQDPSGRRAYLRLDAPLRQAKIQGLTGHYGRIDPTSHVTYETQPSPFVIAYRMCYEFCKTNAPHHHDEEGEDEDARWPSDWVLPQPLSPAAAFQPNRNLLGWLPISTGFSREMGAILERYIEPNYDEGTFEVIGIRNAHGVPLFPDVLDHVSQMLSVVKRGLEENNGRLVEGSGGSCSQTLFQQRVSEDVGMRESGRQLVPVAERILTTYSYDDVGLQLASAAAIFKYRIRRRYENNSDCYCYTGERGGAPPGWADTEDRVFDSQPRWNYADLSGTRVSGTTAAIDFIFKTRKVYNLGD